MSRYVDGFVIPIAKKDLKKYKKMAELGKNVWMKHGALDYYECIGDSLAGPWGLSFSKLCKLKKSETVIFAFIVYKNKSHRKAINKKVEKDPLMTSEMHKYMGILNMKRFTVGGFKVIVNS